MPFRATDDAHAIRIILGCGADNSPAPQSLIYCDDTDTYELRPLLGAFCGTEWTHGDDAAVIPETGDITTSLARFAPVRPGERLVRVL